MPLVIATCEIYTGAFVCEVRVTWVFHSCWSSCLGLFTNVFAFSLICSLFFSFAAEQVQRCTYQNYSHSLFASFLFSLRWANASWPALAINFATGTLNPERHTHPRKFVDTVASGRRARTSKQVYCKKHCKIISPRIITNLTDRKTNLLKKLLTTPPDISDCADGEKCKRKLGTAKCHCKQTVAKLLVTKLEFSSSIKWMLT